MRAGQPLVVGALLLTSPVLLAAEPAAEPGALAVAAEGGADQGGHAAVHHFVVGAVGTYLAAIHDGAAHHFGGGGLVFEAALIPHWLELEYGVRALTDGHALTFPMDLLLKLPFHVSDQVVPFVGAGPTLIPAFIDELETHAGIATTAGVGFWLWSWGGVFAEANYNLVFESDLVHEIGGSGGVGYRF